MILENLFRYFPKQGFLHSEFRTPNSEFERCPNSPKSKPSSVTSGR